MVQEQGEGHEWEITETRKPGGGGGGVLAELTGQNSCRRQARLISHQLGDGRKWGIWPDTELTQLGFLLKLTLQGQRPPKSCLISRGLRGA